MSKVSSMKSVDFSSNSSSYSSTPSSSSGCAGSLLFWAVAGLVILGLTSVSWQTTKLWKYKFFKLDFYLFIEAWNHLCHKKFIPINLDGLEIIKCRLISVNLFLLKYSETIFFWTCCSNCSNKIKMSAFSPLCPRNQVFHKNYYDLTIFPHIVWFGHNLYKTSNSSSQD